jgi:peptidyl-tRNA hydrolase
MALSNPFDAPDAVRARKAQSDPLVQYIVVRRERVPSLSELVATTAAAVVVADRRFAADPAWAGRIAAWRAASFRKVTLRANERDWPRLLVEHEAVCAPAGDPFVAVLPPRYRSQNSKLLRSLQAYTSATSELERGNARASARPCLVLAVNPALTMSAGKLLAQAGHAAMIAADAPARLGADAAWSSALAAWQDAGHPVLVTWPDGAAWERALSDLPCVVVTDSGLTEITPGSRTVLAVRPLDGPALAACLRLLGRAPAR